jgi:LuxR family maltose regulon positive regulatory protein
LLATTRRDPPWPLQRLRLAGLLTEVRDADLAFRSDETEALFAQLPVDLAAEQLERLTERTEGWAAGLRLAALPIRGSEDVDATVRTFSGNDHSVAGYLLDEVLDRQSPELSAFLERISMVDLVCADLADALTVGRDGAAMLAELAASHLFVQAIGRPGRWYRLHRLIVDILRAGPMPARGADQPGGVRGVALRRRCGVEPADAAHDQPGGDVLGVANAVNAHFGDLGVGDPALLVLVVDRVGVSDISAG